MKKTHRYLQAVALLSVQSMLWNTVCAQTITFDTNDFKSVSAYDGWSDSPLRDGRISPAVQVIDNHLTAADPETGLQPNTTAKIVGFQRSRYGSNLAGLRVDLKETFRLTKEPRYVHVMINRPVSDSRMMLITLGKRSERAGQSTEVEQTWSLYKANTKANGWVDAVFEIKGFSYADPTKNGIDIHSLVICPDVADRSNLSEDFACYIDQIEITDSNTPRFATGNYTLSFEENHANSRTDRHLNSVSLSVGTNLYTLPTDAGRIYNNFISSQAPISVNAGQKITPGVNYTGTWMGAFAYVDWNQDGKFSYDVNTDGTPAANSEIVSYNGGNVNNTWRNSLGEDVGNGNRVANQLPAFTVPQTTKPGIYRMRFKVDWSTLDPAGNSTSNNLITANGGGIADVVLNVRSSETLVNASQLNGDIVVASTSQAVSNLTMHSNSPLRIRMMPAPGFTHNGIRITYGYHLSGDSLLNDNPQFFTATIPATAFVDNELTLPGEFMGYGEVRLEGLMVQENIVELDDHAVEHDRISTLELNGTGISLANRSYTLTDNSHSLQDFTQERMVGFTHGQELQPSIPGQLYIDYNRDGHFSQATERHTGVLSTHVEGIFRALWQTEQYQFLFLVNLHAPKTKVISGITHGRFISRLKYVNGQALTTKGVPVATDAYKFLGLIAQPLQSGYQINGKARVRYGHNLDGAQQSGGITQWFEEEIEIGSDSRLNIGYNNMFGTVRILAAFEPTETATTQQVFADEFNGTSIDDSKWSVRQRGNATWARFISSDPNVTFVQDGSLVCQARKNVFDPTDKVPTLSGMRESAKSYALLHGYVEARVLTKPHVGNFPAFWMMPMDMTGGWPTCGEIDIWETIDERNSSWHTVHSNWTYNLKKTGQPRSTFEFACTQDGEWHTYGLLKEADKLTWYVDGEEVFSYAKSTNQSDLGQGQWPYDKAFHLILNQSVGRGEWAAHYDPDFVYETRFDWVRAYELSPLNDVEHVKAGFTAQPPIYDLCGRPTRGKTKGLYVQNGRKFIVK